MKNEVIISKATKNNWERLNISPDDIEKKLTKRANKKFSTKQIIPTEYFTNQDCYIILNKILEISQDIKSTIFSLAVNLLISNSLLELIDGNFHTDNEIIIEILNQFYQESPHQELLEIKLPQERDFLGIVYQSLMNEGTKNKKGSYYTPNSIIKKLLKNLTSQTLFLDPCCGSGSFLLEAAETINNPSNIYGFDLDKTACFIAQINLILKFKDIKFKPNIYNLDFLTTSTKLPKFNIIATNPPWGAITKNEYSQYFSQINSDEIFSYFIIKCSEQISTNGEMHFILPESILNVKTHSDIRKYILDKLQIKQIELLGKIFSGVLSDVIVLSLNNTKKFDNIKIISNKISHNIKQKFYINSPNYNFSILDNKDAEILQKIYATPHEHLDEKSQWGLGIVTGNNSKHISKNKISGEKIFGGKNIKKFKITDTDNYIVYDRKLYQQVAPDEIYRAKEKLVYKFISKKLIFAIDTEQRLFLNSANILIPNIENYSIEEVMIFLNSEIFQYIYEKLFNELKILKGNLMKLPFPRYDKSAIKTLNDENIYKIFKLSPNEISHIKQSLTR